MLERFLGTRSGAGGLRDMKSIKKFPHHRVLQHGDW